MLALTIWQPWASAIALGHKLVENRNWGPPATALDQLIAIHAAKRDPDVEDFITVCRRLKFPVTNHGYPRTPGGTSLMAMIEASFGSVIAVARLERVVDRSSDLPRAQRQWFVGDYGWVLGEVRLCAKPVPCRGLQKLWTLPTDVAAKVAMETAR